MVRDQESMHTTVGMTPARRPAGPAGFDARAALPWLADVVLPGTTTGITAEHPGAGGWTRSHVVAARAGSPNADTPVLDAPLVVHVSGDLDGRLVVELESGSDRSVRRTP